LVYDVWLEVYLGAGDFLVQDHPDTHYNVGMLGRGVDFRWYVIAKDDQGGSASNHDTPWRFETEEINDPPERPHTPNPADDATGVPLNKTLSWSCSDPNGDPLTYDIWFGPPLIPSLVSEGQFERVFSPTGMLKGHEYEWWVIARDDEGAETQGYFWSFTTTNEVYAELEVLRNVSNNYGTVIRDDMIKARFDAAYAPVSGINPLQPTAVMCNAYALYWLDLEQIYFYRDPQNEVFLSPGATYTFDVTAGGGVDQDLEVSIDMPDCEAYFTSPENNTAVSINDGFEVQWVSSCPGTGTVDIYVRNDMGEDIGIHVTTDNDGSYTFSSGELAPAAGSYQIFVDIIAKEEGFIDAPGYNGKSVWRSRISCMLMLYAM
ncbi:MAG: hypothetical protein KAU49_04005, partial [Candidatus Krumholzibacteria bacterium]|nr:hypothetical protein [Candidatus Krumholzibacteria bacterium]